jgi:glyoxylase-like metal-dependent hydrolase (beta-lactamase superfamily II)
VLEDTPATQEGQVSTSVSLEVVTLTLGPAQTNAYLVADVEGQTAVVIDPAWSGKLILEEAQRRGWRITDIWLTHAHFDHFGGAAALVDAIPTPIPVALHPADMPLWRMSGGAALFGIAPFDPGPEPTIALEHGMRLRIGMHVVEVRHAPGHTPGHVVFYLERAGLLFCGDVIFDGSVGRTDLPGGDWDALMLSLRTQVLTLPDDVRLLPGHGPVTTVGVQRDTNPFVKS